MVKRIVFYSLILAIIAGGCSQSKKNQMPQTFSNVSVRTSYNPSAQFPAGSKYAFVKFAADTEQKDELALIDKRLQKALTNELKKKGYTPSEYTDIGFFVAYTIGLQQQIDILIAKSKSQGNEWISAVAVPKDYVSGALLVQVIDARSLEPVWLGVFNADVALDSIDENQKQQRVGYAVSELLKTFPPKH